MGADRMHGKDARVGRTLPTVVSRTVTQEKIMAVPTEVAEARTLTRFAVEMRYPSAEEITDKDIDEAIRIAEATVAWATPLVPLPGT